ncbi:MAG: hypothetical protein BJ554DRAFT_8139 [Olpidium bornovanus]|uniref:G-patch domain-containing protein n=1 Tax=Olpidium bornovanus TaxID=278681 RepID=A0A8H7ZVF4_9FUNG|nr:MAG: hypothetical protein BJ554DRAFT_8139 [Olpidium bornovanus]
MSQYWLNPVVFVQARPATLNSTSALDPPPSSSLSPSPDGRPAAAAPGGFEVWTGDDEYGEDGKPRGPSGAGVTGEERQRRTDSREAAEDQSTSGVAGRDSSPGPPFGRPPAPDRPPPFAGVDVVSLYQQIITQQAGRSALASAGAEEVDGEDAASGGETADEGAEEEVEEDEDEDIFSERPPPKVAQPPRAMRQPSSPPALEVEPDGPLVYCEICELEVPEDDFARHVRGTAHMLSKAMKDEEAGDGASAAAKHRIFGPHGLGPSNVGYRLAVQAGWEFDKGLGVEGQGEIFVVCRFSFVFSFFKEKNVEHNVDVGSDRVYSRRFVCERYT